MSTKLLSKTDYLSYLACPEEFWMSYHEPETLAPFSLDAQHKVEQGNIIDRLAQEWFKDGCVVEETTIDFAKVKFQYEVKTDQYIVKADVVVFHGDKICDIYEVKAATRQKPEHLHDIAFQRMVFEQAGYQVNRTALIHVNSKYAFELPPDYCQYLKIKDITNEVSAILEATKRQAADAIDWLRLEALPVTTSFTQTCGNGLDCAYLQKYHGPFPAYTIFDISRIRTNKIEVLLSQGVIDIQDVPPSFQLSDKMRQQVNIAQQNIIHIDQKQIKQTLGALAYPLYFLDYETFAYVYPAQAGLFPYQQMIFQYSLHVIESEGADVQHYEYLMPSKTASLDDVFLQMSKQIHATEGTVIVWNESFEKTQNRLMADLLPHFSEFLHSVNDRVFDLMKIFSTGLYQHPKFKGSASIKKVLPVLCPELSYKDLEIQSGGTAVIKWHHLTDNRFSPTEAGKVRQDLLKYCELDTWAMVRIWEELIKNNMNARISMWIFHICVFQLFVLHCEL